MFDYNECIRLGLLKRIPPSPENCIKSLNEAERWLEEAENNLTSGSLNSAMIAAYLCMFHSARSLLFLDGFREKSHACIARYLEEKYVKNGILDEKWVILLDHFRETRHNTQYGFGFRILETEAMESIKNSKEFHAQIKRIAGKNGEK